MRPRSLRVRLVLISTLTIAAALTVAGIGLSALFAQYLERSTERRLIDDLNRLAALVDDRNGQLALTQPMSDPRFDVPYGGIYWQITDTATGATLRSRSVWDKVIELGTPLTAGTDASVHRITDPEGSRAIAVARRLGFDTPDGATRLLDLVVAEDDGEMDKAVAGYRVDLFRALVLLAVILIFATWIQLVIGLSPLRAIQRGIGAIRAGKAQTLDGDFPSEVTPLVSEVNELARAQELAIQFARERAADLAHGLKGNLQVLNAEAHQLRLAGHTKEAAEIEELTGQMSETIDHQLGLTRLRRRSVSPSGFTMLGDVAGRIVRTLQKTSRGRELNWDMHILGKVRVALDASDAAELLGALLENAAKWGKARVRLAASLAAGRCELVVEDDGPGLDPAQMAMLGSRGVRLDETRSGSGIGLSIVREIVALNSGTLVFSRSELGGLKVAISLPAGGPVE